MFTELQARVDSFATEAAVRSGTATSRPHPAQDGALPSPPGASVIACGSVWSGSGGIGSTGATRRTGHTGHRPVSVAPAGRRDLAGHGRIDPEDRRDPAPGRFISFQAGRLAVPQVGRAGLHASRRPRRHRRMPLSRGPCSGDSIAPPDVAHVRVVSRFSSRTKWRHRPRSRTNLRARSIPRSRMPQPAPDRPRRSRTMRLRIPPRPRPIR